MYVIDPTRYSPDKIVTNLFAGEDQIGKTIRFNYSWRNRQADGGLIYEDWVSACLAEGDLIAVDNHRFAPTGKTTSEPEQNGQKCFLYEPNGEAMFYTLRDLGWLGYPLFFDTTEPPEGLTLPGQRDLFYALDVLGARLHYDALCPSFAVSAHLQASALVTLSLEHGWIAGCEFFAPLDEAQIAKATYMAENMEMGKALYIVNIEPTTDPKSILHQLGPIANMVILHQHKLCVRVPGEWDKQIPLEVVRKALGVEE